MAHSLGHLGLVERAERHEELAAAEHGVERGQVGVARHRAVGDDHAQAPVGRPLGHADDDPQRGVVEPLGVLDHEGRAPAGEAGDQRVAPGPHVVARVDCRRQVTHRAERVVALDDADPRAG